MTRATVHRLLLRSCYGLAGLALVVFLGTTFHLSRLSLKATALDPKNVATIRVLSRDGKLLREVLTRPDGRSHWVALDQISPGLREAIVIAEDQRFYEHHGVDFRATLRAAAQLLAHGRVVSGASTITMQLVRLLQPRRRSLLGKLEEMALAQWLEARLGKPQILWHYLNRAPFGRGAIGVEAAAQRYFGKAAAELSLAEAAVLAALPQSPDHYSHPRGRQALVMRQQRLLARLRARTAISAQAFEIARQQPIQLLPPEHRFAAPHFVEFVLQDGVDGKSHSTLAQATEIRTTLDLSLQHTAERAAQATVAELQGDGVTGAAVLVVENASGEVRAYVGSPNFFDSNHAGQVDATNALRQPGSTLKPFTYALALEHGNTPATLLADLPVQFTTPHGSYAPHNYDQRFHGPVRLRAALASSYNIPAVRVTDQLGVATLLTRLHALGFASLNQSATFYGLGLTLGNGEVTLHELVRAYATLARGGTAIPLRFIIAARDARGNRLIEGAKAPRAVRIFDERVAYLITDILADARARRPAFGRNRSLALPFPAAVKTGTSADYRDNWTVGYSSEFTVAVWVGDMTGRPLRRVSGVTGAAPLWHAVMRALHEPADPAPFARPAGLVTHEVCALSGALATAECGAVLTEQFIAGHEPTSVCPFHREVALDRRNGLLAGPACDARHVERRALVDLPAAYRRWGARQELALAPETYSPLCPARAGGARAGLRIVAPERGDHFVIDPDVPRSHQTVLLRAEAGPTVDQVEWFVDGAPLVRTVRPFDARWRLRPGRHTISARLPTDARETSVVVDVR